MAAGATRPALDVFLAMSPMGYCYPALLSAAARATNATRLGRYLRDLDLRLLIVLDKSGFETPEIYAPYLEQPQIDALFYWDAFGDYAKYRGAIRWVQDKPVVSAWQALWGETGPAEIAAALNRRPRTPGRAEGYSMIAVHAWSHAVASVRECLEQLDPGVQVVTPDAFVTLLTRNLEPAAH